MIFLHPLFAYTTLMVAVLTFVLYLLGTSLLRNTPAVRYALYSNLLLLVLALFSVLTGFSVAGVPLVQSKVPWLWGFPHQWNGVLLLIFSLLTFVYFWFKEDKAGKLGFMLAFLGLFLAMVQFITGWMIRLVFFD
ncbi:hypothetical protein Thal_0088 [Thermocrinis albus DSM 14484]|uniref:Cytochrome c assembly protein domain-containing protein n=1 Tax=Thermocrinis albus (strain DSM 14484 / JCM 11386 / HI 11/12) TaxID=638303 RepID=D3SNI8_THEAH|nr:hypothetical protein [Thermocrinis albus]ADC88725.1 hypothetical protein Thal_0088 [Thermocrinis albus DSM 14484]